MRVEIVLKDLNKYFLLHDDVDVYLGEMVEAGEDDASVYSPVVVERSLKNLVDSALASQMPLVECCSEVTASNVG